MMEGSPKWWSMNNNTHPPPSNQYPSSTTTTTFSSSPLYLSPHQYLPHHHHHHHQSSSSLALNSLADHNYGFPQSWSQLLLGGLSGSEEERLGGHQSHFQDKKLENWEEEQNLHPSLRVCNSSTTVDDVKQEEVNQSSQLYGDDEQVEDDDQFQACTKGPSNWSHLVVPTSAVSSPKSGLTSLSNSTNFLDFSSSKADGRINQHAQHPSSEYCNSKGNGGVTKKARVQSSSTQPPLKVRKEKLGGRITALHQIVSPFGKTDTASVLLEAIGYIRFLQTQIEALSSPYLGSGSGNMRHPHSGAEDRGKDLRSRGLCLVPVSCTHHVGDDNNGADYWAPALGGGF